ncbi:hypothetical protein SLEP1_g38099 [Rubroshorea leprosula]|uniref:ApaG domain-containing protein n=1 Tax=Rubroshorea leprosula TaxID=152421 RepID=A0AAV5KWS3_9ROSI|nr:hypothetical protein SLEP1_g38099 [Rubroshorea leprosula]
MGLEGVGDGAIHEILSKLGPNDTGKVSCVSKRFRDSASVDSLWSKICLDDLDLVSPQDPQGNPAPSFKAAYQLWREAFAMYPWPLVLRVKRCWGKLKSWLSKNYPEAEATLRGGASESDIEQLERLLKVKLPLPTRVLYRFHDGQELPAMNLTGNPFLLLGIIGGYDFYDHLVNVYLLPLSQVIVETRKARYCWGFTSRSKYIVVAASSTSAKKLFFFNCTKGQLYVGTSKLSTDRDMIPCVPNSLIRSVRGSSGDQHQDAMLLWLEEHGRRMESGIIKVREQEEIRSISLFPEVPPLCSTTVTNGVKIRASAVFVPELANLQHDIDKYLFAYSIRMSLLPDGCIINGMTFNSCQLKLRHWQIRSNDAVAFIDDGEAMIGEVLVCLVISLSVVVASADDISVKTFMCWKN